MDSFPASRIIDFIVNVTPFDMMKREHIEQMVEHMEIAYYPRGEVIMKAGDKVSEYVHIIQTGSIKITVDDEYGNEILIDIREKGDVFGALSILRVKNYLFDVNANEDLITYILPADKFVDVARKYPEIENYFNYSLAANVKDRRKTAISSQEHEFGMDMYLIAKTVADIMVNRVLTCDQETTIRDAVKLMSKRQVGSIIIINESKVPVGIITDTDLRQLVLYNDISFDTQTAKIMSYPVHTINPQSYVIDALLEMSRYGISHLVVVENLRICGIISEHDFHVETGNSPIGVIARIDKSQSVDELIILRPNIDNILEKLIRQKVPAGKSTELITGLNDRITIKINKLIEYEMEKTEFGKAPVSYCWMALGSEGRREQTLRTDQDNALLFENVPELGGEKVKGWFIEYSKRVVNSLVQYGFPRCRGGIMASNAKWCQSEDQWQKIFSGWITNPEPLSLMMASIFFDFRPIYGKKEKIEELRERVQEHISDNKLFLRYMAKNSLRNNPPLGFLRQFIVERTGEHKNELDLKMRGVLPIVESARVLALETRVNETNTLERLNVIYKRNIIDSDLLSNLAEAYDFILTLRLSHHLEARTKGDIPNNFINPIKLSGLQRSLLKESFSVINQFQEQVGSRFGTNFLIDK